MENYKKVDSNYLHNKIINNDYKKRLIQKVGVVDVSLLNLGEKINIYYYNEHAEIQTKPFVANVKDLILITKKINNKLYNSVMTPLMFHKLYTKLFGNKFIPIKDPLIAYLINEKIQFTNVYNQVVNLKEDDYIIPFAADHKDFFSIYKYNFMDNYIELENDAINSSSY